MTKTIEKGDVMLLKKSSNSYSSNTSYQFYDCSNIKISDETIEFEYSTTDENHVSHSKRTTSNCAFIVTEDI